MGGIYTPSQGPALKPAASAGYTRGVVPQPTLPTNAYPAAAIAPRVAPRSEPSSPTWFLDASLVLQMDAIIFSFFRRRLEHDASAVSTACAYTASFGKLHSPLSTVCSVFAGSCAEMRVLVRRAQSEHATGLFICKAAPDDGPRDFDGATWFERLTLEAKLHFDFKGPCCRDISPSEGALFCPLVPVKAFVVSFNRADTLHPKSDKRKEKKFTLAPITTPLSDGKVGALPLQLARASPLAPQRGTPRHGAPPDRAPPSEPLPPFDSFKDPKRANSWNKLLFERMACFYPLADVAAIAREAISDAGFNAGFVGNRQSHITATNMVSDPEMLTAIRTRLKEEVGAGRVAGPFARCPFPTEWCPHQGRYVPLGQAPKFKYDPESDEFRLVSDFSAHKPHSTNDLCWNPLLLDCPLQASQLMAILATAGVDAQVFTGDIKKAFRNQFVRSEDLQLFVYMLSETEFYVDLRHPFGHITSEFCFHSITAVIQWAFAFMGVSTASSQAKNFVDNWFLVAPKSDPTFTQRARQLELTLVDLGVIVHEQQQGPKFNALGWDWDTLTMTVTCPTDKRLHFSNQSSKWAADAERTNTISLKRVEKITGTLNFLALAAPCLRLAVGHFKLLRRKAINRKAKSITLSMTAMNSLKWLQSFLAGWSGSSSFVIPFSPRDSWSSLVRSDAATDWGFGAMLFPQCTGVMGKWSTADREAARKSDNSDKPELDSDSSTVIELLAFKKALTIFGPTLRGQRVQFELDSQTAVLDLRSWNAGRPGILAIVNDVWSLLISFEITARFEHILRDFNMIADALSKNLLTQAKLFFRQEFSKELLVQVVDDSRTFSR